MVPSNMDSPIWGMTTGVPPEEVNAAGSAACSAGAVSPLSEMTATTVLIPSVTPSGNLMAVRMPATGDGISASTLSVEISKSGSSFSTRSPVFLSHLVMVPSTIDSPIWGMITSVGMNPSLRTSELVCGQFLPDYKSLSNRFVGRGSTLNWTLFGVQKSFDLAWNLERRILRRKIGYGFSLGAQKMKILDGQHLLTKNHAKLAGCLMRNGFEGRKLSPLAFWLVLNFKRETGDRSVGDAAGIDKGKIAQVGGDVERKTVRSDSARDVDAYCANLALSFWVVLFH